VPSIFQSTYVFDKYTVAVFPTALPELIVWAALVNVVGIVTDPTL
jgi:hypothetical protein